MYPDGDVLIGPCRRRDEQQRRRKKQLRDGHGSASVGCRSKLDVESESEEENEPSGWERESRAPHFVRRAIRSGANHDRALAALFWVRAAESVDVLL